MQCNVSKTQCLRMIRTGKSYNRHPPYLRLLCYYCGYITDTPVTTEEHSFSHLSVCVYVCVCVCVCVCVMRLYLRGVIVIILGRGGGGGGAGKEIEAGFGSLLGHKSQICLETNP